jgi:hypothetical protein
MTVLVPGETGWEFVWHERDDLVCFLCGHSIPRQWLAVHWDGATGAITLHRGCATSFVLRLARDCWELERHEAMEGVD